ncbi:MAG: DUF3488 domain-containing protein, partial [Proteobacteria bacterium]|nr:DUF3488 domain-containing protein [Pseudomonadota bacterium]
MSAAHPLAPEQRAVAPRDLGWLLLALLLVAAPHALRMPWWLTLLVLTLYAWRGPVLWDFDGRTWRMGPGWIAPFEPPQGAGRYDYVVTLEPHNRTWLFALESAASLPPRARYTNDGMVVSATPIRTRMRYALASLAEPQLDA